MFLIVGFLRLNDVSIYTPDSARYLILGNSIAHGKGFVDDSQPDPDRFVINAPFYAVLIAPVEALFPMSVVAVKVWTLLWGVCGIVLLYIWTRRTWGSNAALIGSALLAFNPAMILYSTEVLSEAPFIVFYLAAFLLCGRMITNEGRKTGAVAFLAACIALIPLLREAGVAMVLATALALFSQEKKKAAAIVFCSSVALAVLWYVRNQVLVGSRDDSLNGNISVLFQHFVSPEGSSIFVEFGLRAWLTLKAYVLQVGGLLFFPLATVQLSVFLNEPSSLHTLLSGLMERGQFLVLGVVGATSCAGIVHDFRVSRVALQYVSFAFIYLLIILLYPVHDIRFLLPLLPPALYYTVGGIKIILSKLQPAREHWQSYVIAGATAIVLFPNVVGIYHLIKTNASFSQQDVPQLRSVPPPYQYRWGHIGKWIEANIPPDAVIASPVKDIVAVAGNRKVVQIGYRSLLPRFETLIRDYDVQYVFAPMWWQDLRAYEFHMRESRRLWFEPVSGESNIMKVHSRFTDPVVTSHPHENFDARSPSELLRMGRKELVGGLYPQAVATLRHALDLAPGQPDVLFQLMAAALMNGDTVEARTRYQELLVIPQAFSSIEQAQSHWESSRVVASASDERSMEVRATMLQHAASLYWQMGYPRRAAEVLEPLLDDKTDYFVGLLWGLHYHLENGDTVQARLFLAKLGGIDKTNVLVHSYEKILATGDSLTKAGSDSARSRFHLVLAECYRTMDLPEEALDHCEQALRFDGKNIEALMTMGKVFEGKGRPRAALRGYRRVLQLQPGRPDVLARTDSLSHILSSE